MFEKCVDKIKIMKDYLNLVKNQISSYVETTISSSEDLEKLQAFSLTNPLTKDFLLEMLEGFSHEVSAKLQDFSILNKQIKAQN
jgi:hypothetical protein